MEHTTVERLTHRLDRLERQVRRWRFVAAGAVLFVIAVALLVVVPRSRPEDLTVRRLTFIGNDGKERIRFVSDAGTIAGIEFLDGRGATMGGFYARAKDGREGAGIRLEDPGTKQAFTLSSVGATALLGDDLMLLQSGGLMFSKRDGKGVFQRSYYSDSYLEFGNSVAGPRASLGVEDGSASIVIRGKGTISEHSQISMRVEQGSPQLLLSDVKGQIRAAVGTLSLTTVRTGKSDPLPPSSLVLFDKDGNVIWTAP